MVRKKTVKDVELELAERLLGSLGGMNLAPVGYEPHVRLHGRSRDKRRTASFETSWSPETDSIIITFRQVAEQANSDPGTPVTGDEPGETTVAAPQNPASGASASDCLPDLIRALGHAEARPGYKFVALKWFRDTVLPAEGFSWAQEYSARDRVLRDAIERRLVLTSREPNPRSPQFPVTAIRLNRWMQEVKAAVGNGDDMKPDFQPVPIRGESLSDTILRDRR